MNDTEIRAAGEAMDDKKYEALKETANQLARDILMLAAYGGMADSYWSTDSMIARACKQLGWTSLQAQSWAEDEDNIDAK